MTVYVDNSFIKASVPYRGRKIKSRWCHMFAHPDERDELHALAASIGLRREWFQADHRRPEMHHYDLTEPRRRAAVAAGAVEVTWREAANLMRSWW